MALQNNYKAVIDYSRCDTKVAYTDTIVMGRAGSVEEVVRRIQEKFGIAANCRCRIMSIEYLGWETF